MTFAERYGPWAIVTGASSGIGLEFSRLLAERGLNLLLVARRVDRLNSIAAELRSSHGVAVELIELDLAGSKFIDTLLAAVEEKDVGLIVSNAGLGFKGPHHKQDRTALDRLLAVNTRAPTLLTNALAPRLIERGRGGIIITGSVEGFMSSPWSAAYAATKAFVHFLGEALWDELKPHGIDVLVVAPGATDTENLRLQGFDASRMGNVMAPRAVAEAAVANLTKGPIHIAGRANRAMVRFMSLLTRKTRIGLVGKGTRMMMEKAAVRS